jgi:hypothetical protein
VPLQQLPMHNVYYEPLQPPNDCYVYNDELCDLWIDHEGILCSVCKNVRRTVEKQKTMFALIRKITDNKKVCYLADSNDTGPLDQEARKHCNVEIPKLFKAVAFIAHTPTGQLAMNTFLTFSPQNLPMRLFQHREEARHWIRQYNF